MRRTFLKEQTRLTTGTPDSKKSLYTAPLQITNMKKGMELPINMIVIIALAVLILVIITAFTTSQVGQGVGNIDVERAFAAACTKLRAQSCVDTALTTITENVQGFPTAQSLIDLCTRKGFVDAIGTTSATAACKAACGCLA